MPTANNLPSSSQKRRWILSGSESIDDQQPAVDLLQRVSVIMAKLAAIDPDLGDAAELAEGVSAQVQELSLEISGYGDEVEYDPVRLNEIEERLEVINMLKRRYGMTIELVLEQAEKARTDLENIDNQRNALARTPRKRGRAAQANRRYVRQYQQGA